jgi:hypothetical protein
MGIPKYWLDGWLTGFAAGRIQLKKGTIAARQSDF